MQRVAYRVACFAWLLLPITLSASDAIAQEAGECERGAAEVDLDANQVRARLYNTGGLFWKGGGPHYNVPKSTPSNAIFAASIWMGGLVDDELHMVASDYGPWELWPGPIDEGGKPPSDCAAYDRMYKVSRSDIERYEKTGSATSDLADWPVGLGAPVIDGDGDPSNYDLADGDRPEIIGDQAIWWVMNDLGNEHSWSLTPPVGLEVRVLAYAFDRQGPLGTTTFYRYTLVNKGDMPWQDAYFGFWIDPDLGDAGDDYVGSDSLRSIGFVWNGDDFDGGTDGYGDQPPALGIRVLQGAVAQPDAFDNDRDGTVDEPGERAQMSYFVYYSSDSTIQGNPDSGDDAYLFLKGLWRDGRPMTYGGTGVGFSDTPTRFMFSGEPGEFWSEENTDGIGSRNTPSDRRFLLSSGPFTLDPGESDTIDLAIVWSQGLDRYDSVRKMKTESDQVFAAFSADFPEARRPSAPRVDATALAGAVLLKWGYEIGDDNFLDRYDVVDPYLIGSHLPDSSHSFEGYNVFRFNSPLDDEGEIIATFDVINGVTRVFDVESVDSITGTEIPRMTADGSDSGVRHDLRVDSLVNFREYHFGVQTYAYSEHSNPKVVASEIARITVLPAPATARSGGTVLADSAYGVTFTQEDGRITKETLGGGDLTVRVIDPTLLTGHTYRLEFFEHQLAGGRDSAGVLVYSIRDQTDGRLVFDGAAAADALGADLPVTDDVVTVDGLSWSLNAPLPDVLSLETLGPLSIDGGSAAFVQVQGPPGDEPCGPSAESTFGCAEAGGNLVYGSFNGQGDWIMYHQGTGPEGTLGAFAPNDYEIRATAEGSYGYFGFSSGNIIEVPYEVWDIGPTGPFGVNDPSDDEQLISWVFSDGGGECFFGFDEGDDPFGLGWEITDRIYAYYPMTTYDAWEAAARPLVEADPDACPTSPATDEAAELIDTAPGRPIQRIVFMMDPTDPDFRQEFIPVGNVIRFLTTKPHIAGDYFVVETEGYAVETGNAAAARNALDRMAIVPNPYVAVSDYEITRDHDVVRFTNMPEVATIRVFQVSGTLVWMHQKDSPATHLDWNLRNDNGLEIASGMYLVHVDVPGVGERVMKLGVVKKPSVE